MLHILMLIAVLTLADPAGAAIYQCTDAHGRPIFSDNPCGNDARRIKVEDHQSLGGRADNSQMLQRYDERKDRREERAKRAGPKRRRAPGVAECPTEKRIKAAIDDHRIVHCMTTEEVLDAQPLRGSEPDKRQRLLETGISVTEWYYATHEAQWPAIIWFRAGKVTGFE